MAPSYSGAISKWEQKVLSLTMLAGMLNTTHSQVLSH